MVGAATERRRTKVSEKITIAGVPMHRIDELDTIVVFTARSPKRILEEGGSQAWVLNPARAKLAKWLVVTQNRHNPDHEFSDATEPHGSAFMVARISGIRQSDDEPKTRWLIEIDEYAEIALPDAWRHWRNPVRYTTRAVQFCGL